MSSKDKFKQHMIQRKSNEKTIANNIKSYSLKNLSIENSINSSYNMNDGRKNSGKKTNESKYSKYQAISRRYPITKKITQDKNDNSFKSRDISYYEYSSGTNNTSSAINLKHHPNQVNNLIHNHKYYSSKTTNTSERANKVKTSKTITSTRTENSQRTKSLSPIKKNYEVETKKVEIYEGKQRYSLVSNSSGETNISISKSQLKKLMTNMWLEEIYCSNVESLCCLVDNSINKNNGYYLNEMHEKELEENSMIMKEYEAEIIKLKSVLNIKEQEMKNLIQNLKQKENQLKIKNKKICELNIKTEKGQEEFDKDTHELQIISTKQELKKNIILEKDAISLQILSMKKGWNDTNVPSPINEIYIETVKHEVPNKFKKFEKMRRIMKIKEEEKIRKMEKISKLEMQEMGLLSIISKKPKKINLCQHLESIMIYPKEKKYPLTFQKIEEIVILSHAIKTENEIQELDGLEIINIKKNKKIILQEQCLNGLEIRRDYDMLLVKPVWDSLKIQGAGLNLLSMKKEEELENEAVDEFEIFAKEKPENIMKKVNSFKIAGKIKRKVDYRINRERIKIIGIPKEEINWDEINTPTKTARILIKRNYNKIEPKIEINWDDIIKPIKTTKLFVKGKQPKVNKFKMAKRDKFNFLYSSPVKDEYDVENFNINLINSERKSKSSLKMAKGGFNIKGKEQKKIPLIKNRMDSINIFGLKEKNNLIPFSIENIHLTSELEIDLNKNWNKNNKVMKGGFLKIMRKNKKQNIISKKVVNIEIKTEKKIILKPIKAVKLLIRGFKEEIKEKPLLKEIKTNKLFIGALKKPPLKEIKTNKLFIGGLKKVDLKEIKTNKLFIRALKKVEKKPKILLIQKKEVKLLINGIKREEPKIPDWNDINKLKKENSIKLIGKKLKKINWKELIKVEKKPSINYIHRAKKIILKKQNISAFDFKGIERIVTKEKEKVEIINNWDNSLRAQRNAKFSLKGIIKRRKLEISKGSKFMIKIEPEEEIIYNDDYNYLSQKNKENGKEKIIMIKEKEVTPMLHREIRAQVLRVKEDSSETSSQSDVDVLSGIKKKKMLMISSGKELTNSGFNKKVINGEVIFTPRNNLGVNLGGAKYKKEILIKKGLKLENRTMDQGRMSAIEITGNNGEIYFERMSGIGGAIKEGNYQIINGNFYGDVSDNINTQKQLKTIYQSSGNIKRSNKISKEPSDSKKKINKKQLIIKSKIKNKNSNQIVQSEGICTDRIHTNGNFIVGSKKIIFNPHLTSGNIQHSASTFGIGKGNDNIISIRKEESISHIYRDNGNLISKNSKKKIETSGNLNDK